MIGTIRKHSTWLWAIIIVATIIAFVYFFSPDARYNFLGKSGQTGWHINHRPISIAEYQDALREAKLAYYARYQTFPDEKDEMAKQNWVPETMANQRLLIMDKLKALNIQVGPEAVRLVRDEMLGHPANPAAALQTFYERTLSKAGLTLGDFEQYVRHEAGLRHMVSLAGMSGQFTTAQEAEQIYRREFEEVAVEMVYLPFSNFVAQVTNITEEALRKTYTNRLALYQVPERLQVSYVRFELSNYLAQAQESMNKVTNLTAQIDAIYRSQPVEFWKDKDDKPLNEEAAKAKIQKEMLENEARRLTYKKGYEFVNGFNPDKTNLLADFEALAAASNLTVHVSAPFDQQDPPADMKVPDKFVELAFRMTNAEPVSLNPIPGEDGTYVFALKQRLPIETPAFEKVRDKVLGDYKESEAQAQARSFSTIFYNDLTNGLALKKPFTGICLDNKLTPVPLASFSRMSQTITNLPAGVSLREIKREAFNLTPGSVSPVFRTAGGYAAVFLRNRFPVDEEKLKKELPVFLANVRMMRQNDAANEWFGRQGQATLANSVLPKSEAEQKAERERQAAGGKK